MKTKSTFPLSFKSSKNILEVSSRLNHQAVFYEAKKIHYLTFEQIGFEAKPNSTSKKRAVKPFIQLKDII